MAKPTKSSPVSTSTAAPSGSDHTRLLLGIICFFAGAAIMVIEISANRLLAPYFGNSLYTWTALIGVVLVSVSVGGYLGGYLADKTGRMDLLGWLLASAAFLTMLIPTINTWFAPTLAKSDIISGPVMISILILAIPGVLLGAVSPASVRFFSLAGNDEHVGSSAGIISMLGSLGSFIGTFVSGFFLLSAFGVKTIFIGSGAVLLVLALLAFWMAKQSWQPQIRSTVMVLLAGLLTANIDAKPGEGIIHQASSFYHQIEVTEREGFNGPERYLKLDSTVEGGLRVKDGALVLDYQHFWQLVHLKEDLKIQRALFIGAGAFGMPQQVSKAHPEASVDVAEIDPAVVATGRKFFNLDAFPKVQAHAEDARRFVNGSSGNYDLIFGDAYNGVRHIPAHLVTKEFFQEVKTKLSKDGVFLMNVISAVEGEKAELFAHILATLRSVFPHVEAFSVGGAPRESQNIILLASEQSWKPWLEDTLHVPGSTLARLAGRHLSETKLPAAAPVMTDDWNPVDAVIARQLLK
jgi:spermidine synthase